MTIPRLHRPVKYKYIITKLSNAMRLQPYRITSHQNFNELIILDTNGSLQHWTSLLYVRNIEQVYYM